MTDLYTTSNFVRRAQRIHKENPYDYSKVLCTKHNDRVTITCKIHGDFSLLAYSHIAGRGCRTCGTSTSQKDFKDLLRKFNLELKSPYLGVRSTVKFFCEHHGLLEDVAENILHGGCFRCKYPYRLIPDFLIHSFKIRGLHPTYVYHNLKEPILATTLLDIYCLNCKTYSHPSVINHLSLSSRYGCAKCKDME